MRSHEFPDVFQPLPAGPTYSPVDSLAPAMPNVSFAPAPDWLSPHSLDPRLPGPSARRNRSVSDPPPCSPQDNHPPMGRARASTVTNRIPFPEPQISGPSLRSEAHNAPYLSNPPYHTMGSSPYPSLRQQPQHSMACADKFQAGAVKGWVGYYSNVLFLASRSANAMKYHDSFASYRAVR